MLADSLSTVALVSLLTRSIAALGVLVLIAAPAAAQVPPSSVTVTTSANFGLDSDPTHAGPGGQDFFDDSSVALGQAGLPGSLQSRTKAGGVGGDSGVVE